MDRTDAPGNDSGRYTEGNPTLNIPATVVSAKAANHWQEEIYNCIVGAGITPDELDETQLQQAILSFISTGGSQTSQTIANNTTSTITSLNFDKLVVKSIRIFYDIERTTDSGRKGGVGEAYFQYDSDADDWVVDQKESFDSGVILSIDATGQVSYTSDDLTGTSYAGTMRITEQVTIAQ